MRKTILILSLFLSAYNLFSQQDSVLKNFKFRDVNYRAITFGVSGSGHYNNEQFAGADGKNHGGSGSIGAIYSIVKSTDRILLNTSVFIGTNYNNSKGSNGALNVKHRTSSISPGLSVLNKWYTRDIFFELGLDGKAYIYSSKDIHTNLSNVTNSYGSKQGNYEATVTAGVGKGRLENVTSMQNALWLHDALKKEGRLTRSLTADELNGLGQAIVKANNTRVLDYRKRTQFILETVDNYLQHHNLIDKTDIRYFSNLNDILFFAINASRLSGTETYIRVTPGIAYLDLEHSQSQTSSTNETDSKARSGRVTIGINRYRPASLHHQNNYGIGIYAGYRDNDYSQKQFASGVLVSELRLDPVLRQAGINLFFGHSIYPNTRTIIDFNVHSEGGFQTLDAESSSYGQVRLVGILNYFISYRTRFMFNVGTNYQSNIYGHDSYYHTIQKTWDNFQLFVNAGIEVNL
jgi:hypothetical protein